GALTRKGPTKDDKKGRNLWERQSHGDPNGPAIEKGGQTKDHAKLFSGPRNFVPAAK
ncbi:hypothetical protein Tco_0659558, partial [Tanacetum coccineum]